ncbi:MAG TPA: hypothetical protein VNB94_06865, partial [Mycobacteriales bacterium]|nr:hypothetical protein [Mycobacteriales bacterium]
MSRSVWAATSTFHVAGWDLGVRSSTPELDELVRRALTAHHQPGLDAPANFSLEAPREEESVRGARPLHLLYENWSPVATARSDAGLVQALLGQLESYALVERTDLPVLNAGVLLTGDGRAIVQPRDHRKDLQDRSRALAKDGLTLHPSPLALLDPASGEIVIEPTLTVDESVLSSPVTPGRFPIAAWGLHAPGEFGAALSRAAAALRAFPHV